MVHDIVILGAGGHAKEIAQLIEDINLNEKTWNLLGFIDKDSSKIGMKHGRHKIIGDENYFDNFRRDLYLTIAIGSPSKTKSLSEHIVGRFPHILIPNLIHPSVVNYKRNVSMGEGNIICAGNILTTDIILGSFNCINRGCNISHDVVIKDFCLLNPGVNISGGVSIESGCLIGTGATILQYLNIGENATVGAGAVVTKDVENGKTVVGIPAQPTSSD